MEELKNYIEVPGSPGRIYYGTRMADGQECFAAMSLDGDIFPCGGIFVEVYREKDFQDGLFYILLGVPRPYRLGLSSCILHVFRDPAAALDARDALRTIMHGTRGASHG